MSTNLSVTLDPRASGADRLAAWQDVMSATGTVHVADPDGLAGTLCSREIGSLRTIRITATTFRLVRDQAKAAAVAREHVLVNLVEAGGFAGRLAGRTLLAGPGDLVLSRLGNLMDVTLTDADWLALVLPQSLLQRHLPWDAKLDGSVRKAGTVTAGVVGGLLRSLCALGDDLTPREVTRATRSALATLAACLGDAAPAKGKDKHRGEVTAKAIQGFIARRLSDPRLDMSMIGRHFGLSRSALYRTMAGSGDLVATIRTLRLQAIARDIAAHSNPPVPLATLAARHGMDNERSFRRAFAREFGHPPSLLRKGDPPALPATSPGSVLQDWFSGL